MMELLRQDEILLQGKWLSDGQNIIANDICKRIEWLIGNHLKYIKSDAAGWDKLYIDPNDNRYWELFYPESEQHGGGPPALAHLPAHIALKKYEV